MDNEELKENLMENYLSFQGLLHRYYEWKRREEGPHANPHRGQGRILSILKLQPEISQKELNFLLDMRPQSLGELLTKLEKAEFITRTPSEEDKRVMIVKLTETGAAEAEKVNQGKRESIFDKLSDDEQAQFATIIEKLTAVIEEELPEDAKNFERHHESGRGRKCREDGHGRDEHHGKPGRNGHHGRGSSGGPKGNGGHEKTERHHHNENARYGGGKKRHR